MTIKFGQESTTDDVLEGIDLTGMNVLVTGISAGLGVETVRVLVSKGADVVGTARDIGKARQATREIVTETANSGQLEIVEMDLASLASVKDGADQLLKQGNQFDVVIANAGVMACPQGKTKDGFEIQFGTNHLGHFVFVNRLAPLIKDGGRVVVLSSLAHRFADIDFEDLNIANRPYMEFEAYGCSKTANVLFAVEFDRRHKSRGVRATAVHPGGIQTELARHITPEVAAQLAPKASSQKQNEDKAGAMGRAVRKTVPQGAATSVWCGFVADAGDVGGRYCEDCHVAEVIDDLSVNKGVASYAVNPERAALLWAASEELVGEHYSS